MRSFLHTSSSSIIIHDCCLSLRGLSVCILKLTAHALEDPPQAAARRESQRDDHQRRQTERGPFSSVLPTSLSGCTLTSLVPACVYLPCQGSSRRCEPVRPTGPCSSASLNDLQSILAEHGPHDNSHLHPINRTAFSPSAAHPPPRARPHTTSRPLSHAD